MTPVPVQPFVETHVEPDEHDGLDTELDRKVKRLKSRIAAVADYARPIEKQLVCALFDRDLV